MHRRVLLLPLLCAAVISTAAEINPLRQVGVARVEITPQGPVRLNGFGFRRTESEGVDQPIFATALAIGSDREKPVIIVTIDQCILPATVSDRIAAAVRARTGIERDHLALSVSHSHTTPMLTGATPTIFGVPIPPEHVARVDQYTDFFVGRIADCISDALKNRKPARLEWTLGRVPFAANRRTRGGPVDHDLPTLFARDRQGRIVAVYTTYACHCVSLSHNKITGDWIGFAQRRIEETIPGAVALVNVGGGADANPDTGVGKSLDECNALGKQVAVEIARLAGLEHEPIRGKIVTRLSHIDLPFDKHPTRAEWEEKAKRQDAIGHHARVQLAKLDRGESLRTSVHYPIQTFRFGTDLAMIFLGGELVVDYPLRLKREFDRSRIWVHGYCNDVPGYIPSERILKEGGYEGGDAMVYYDQPTRFAPGLEDRIVAEIHAHLGNFFDGRSTAKTEGLQPLSPRLALATLRTQPDLKVELVAAEPLVADPVAIDFAPDGSLFVAEMRDYPSGMDGQFKPGGTVRRLTASRMGQAFDKSTLFLDNVPFPTGVFAWNRGVLVCAAPDIVYAEDTNGDGVADIRKVLYSGFATHNYQARINSIRAGLDGWLYVAAGIFGGQVKSFSGRELDVSNRDFRIRPETGEIEAVEGNSQQSRVRDDAGEFFGCDSGTLIRHYPFPAIYARRNPDAAPPNSAINLSGGIPVRSINPRLQLFALSGDGRMPTAACGLDIYRDDLFGPDWRGNAFTCEPVYNSVVRLILEPSGISYSAHKPAENSQQEFLSSTDTYFRPVQVRGGPDGALYVVDMYRFVIEHPRWINPDRLSQVDVRAGEGMGRIYRILPRGQRPRSIVRIDELKTTALLGELNSPSGTRRDQVQLEIVRRKDSSIGRALEKMAASAARPEVRSQALALASTLHAIAPKTVETALADPSPIVRRQALRASESLSWDPEILRAAQDPDVRIRYQLALSLGSFTNREAGEALGRLLLSEKEPFIRAAALSSASGHAASILSLARQSAVKDPELIRLLLSLSLKENKFEWAGHRLDEACSAGDHPVIQLFVTELRKAGRSLEPSAPGLDPALKAGLEKLSAVLQKSRRVALESASVEERIDAIRLLGPEDLSFLEQLLSAQTPEPVQAEVLRMMKAFGGTKVLEAILNRWDEATPGIRQQAAEVLLSRPAWTRAFLQEAQSRPALKTGLTPVAKAQLASHPDAQIQSLARKILDAPPSADRQEVIRRYASVAQLQGNPEPGRAIFQQRCATCHQLQGIGSAVGPDLAGLSDVSAAALLADIIDPNRAVMGNFVSYTIETRDGRSFTGIVTGENESSIMIRSTGGIETSIRRAEIVSQTSSGKSMMPEGLESDLSPGDFANLVAFVQSNRRLSARPRKVVPGNQPATIVPDAGGILAFTASKAELYGGEISFEEPFQNVGFWSGPRDEAAWTAHLSQPVRAEVYLEFACATPGNPFALTIGSERITGVISGTGGWDQYRSKKLGEVALPAGDVRVVLQPAAPEIAGALADVRQIVLIPRGKDASKILKAPFIRD